MLLLADDCTSNIPYGNGYGTQCNGLDTDANCTQACELGFADNNNNAGQDYTCPSGVFAGTPLVCTGN
jgi:hypothetical protein